MTLLSLNTYSLWITVLVEDGNGKKMQVNGPVRQKDGGNQEQWKA